MAFDKPTRNALAKMVGGCRRLLTEDIRTQLQAVYGLQPDGSALALESLGHLDESGRVIARELREWQQHLAATEIGTDPKRNATAFDRMAGETAFTVLNRLAALRMCEERGHVVECVRRGMESDGFQLYERLLNGALGTRPVTYRFFLERMFEELAVDLGVLFALDIPQSLVFPSDFCLEQVLRELNTPELAHLWKHDETIGWIYQYFNSKEEREAMREASAAPRNSRELAVRNQFFTPRYVVEFLVDNTLGRIWYEMRKGDTALKDACRYLVRRPTETFLKEGQSGPTSSDAEESVSQEEFLNKPVYIAHRPKKDPRDLKILDPACGSGHFLLYAFDLLETIYEEGWADKQQVLSEVTGNALRDKYPDLDSLRRDMPELILRHNLHGIDIDLRACQIAALALWLRAQQSYQRLGFKSSDRPRITRSNIVCAEPMPGEQTFLDAFLVDLQPKAIAQVVQAVFEKMKLAGEAGSLLQIEEEIADAVAGAKSKWLAGSKPEQGLLFEGTTRPQQGELDLDFSGITEETFWERAEERIYDALESYAERAESGQGYQRRLFANDAVRGFAFIDLCRKRYDIALMNPPFGESSVPSKRYIEETYGDTKGDVYKAFVESFQNRLMPAGYLGIISSRTGFFLGESEDWRTRVVLRLFRPIVFADLGIGVLDAMVEVAAYVLRSLSSSEARDLTLSLVPVVKQIPLDGQERFSLPKWQAARNGLKRHQAVAELEQLDAAGFIRRSGGDIVRYSPLWQAVKSATNSSSPVFPPLVCIRTLSDEDKAGALAEALTTLRHPRVFVCDPIGFSAVPGSPFSYWVSQRFRNLFRQLPPMQGRGRYACVTNQVGEDFRYYRASWEVPSFEIGRLKRWVPLAKGGAYSPFYSDLHLVVDWDEKRCTYRGFIGTEHRPLERPASANHFFRPGITWPRRTDGLSFRILPSEAVFSNKGPAIFCDNDLADDILSLCGLLCSSAFGALLATQLGRVSLAQSFEVGLVQQTPIPDFTPIAANRLAGLARRAWNQKRVLDAAVSTSHAFLLPTALAPPATGLRERASEWAAWCRSSEGELASIQGEIDDLAFCLYGLDKTEGAALASTLSTEHTESAPDRISDEEESPPAELSVIVADLMQYALGAVFGRWDIRYATGENSAPELPDPFAPLPICPPGQLQDKQGLPITEEAARALKEQSLWNYPIDILWEGVLVDDPDSNTNVVVRVREVLAVSWKMHVGSIEQEACEILDVKDIGEYFRKPTLFFANHLRRYSKSRRQAPIYLPLSTASSSYTLWIYYHRLNDDTLFGAVNKYVKPKIEDTERKIQRLESDLAKPPGREASKLRVALENANTLLSELCEFQKELLRVAELPYKPNLNDGVLITAAPLWKLFRLPKWRKDLQECWKKLEAGEYAWSHLAYSIWPDRVRDVCKYDRSIAIAHGLEELCEVAVKPTKKKASKKQKVEETVPGDAE